MTDKSFAQFAEIGLLSILLKDASLLNKCANIKSYMFTSTPNRCLYDTLLELYNNNVYPDYNTLVATLYSDNKLGMCGGEGYIQYLVSQENNSENIEELSKLVLNSYKSRELISLSNDIGNLVTKSSDVNTVIEQVKEFLDNLAVNNSTDGVVNFLDASKETWDLLASRIENPNKIGVTTGFKNLDSVTAGFEPGTLWVVAGRPGMGKSAWMCNAVTTGVPSLIFSREMSRDSLVQRIVAIKSGVPIFNLRLGTLVQSQLDKIEETIREIKNYPIYIDANFNSSIEYLVSTIRKYVAVHGVKVVHIDYLQLLIERDDGATNELGRITRTLKILANELGICIVLYSQLNRLVESRPDKRPVLSDLRQSGNIEEDVDIAIFLYRDIVYNPDTKLKDALEFLIRKQRNGPTGVLTAKFDDVTNKITEE